MCLVREKVSFEVSRKLGIQRDVQRSKEVFCSWGCLSHARKSTQAKASDTGLITYGAIKGAWNDKSEEENVNA